MERERFPITDFGGIIKRADAEDIPDNAASDSNNIDGDAEEGLLMAIPTAVSKTATYSISDRLFEWIKTKDNKWNLVHCNGVVTSSYLNVTTDFYGTLSTGLGGATAGTFTSMVAHNEEVHVANGGSTVGTPTAPNWTGFCDYGQFGGAVLGWKSLSAVIPRPTHTTDYTISNPTPHTSAGANIFDITKVYQYNISAVFDGLQESPLGSSFQSVALSGIPDADYLTMTITIVGVASINPRITGYKLYRREVDIIIGTAGGDKTLWKLLCEFNATTAVAYVDRNGSNISWGGTTDKTVVYVDNNTDIYSSYEEQSGMPESLTTSDVYYSLNTDLNAYHFVAGCLKTGLPDASMMMFRSKQYRYDMFDWTNDYLKLPTVPTALKAYAGKIWAFDENNCYRINPEGMFIEDPTAGVGCLSQRSIVVTDYGMFWCDAKNAYWHDGESIIPIGDAIKTNCTSSVHWHGFDFDYTVGSQNLTPIVVFHAPKNTVLFIIPDHAASSGESNVWAFHVQKRRWDKWLSFTACGTSATGFGAFSGKNGEVYVSTGAAMVEALGGTTWRAFYWISKIFDFDQPGRLKKFYKLFADYTSTTAAPTFTFGQDRATPTTAFTSFEFKDGAAYIQGRLMQLKVTEATGYGNTIRSMEILLRRLDEL